MRNIDRARKQLLNMKYVLESQECTKCISWLFWARAKLSGEREGGIIKRLGKNKGITIGAKNCE